jgi:hypothetical protein
VKVGRFIRALRYEFYGLPLLAGGIVGVVVLGARRASDAWMRALAGWLAVVIAFFVLGLVSPVEMRAALSAQPVVAALFGFGTAALWSRGALGKIAALVLGGAVAGRGLLDWLGCLGQVVSG